MIYYLYLKIAGHDSAYRSISKIEVACFISKLSDAPEAKEDRRKGKTPKEKRDWSFSLGHAVKNCMTVIVRWGAI